MASTGMPSAPTQGTWPSGTMTAAQITAVGKVEAAQVPVPGPLAGHALVEVALVGLCGTDLELLHGEATYITDGRIELPWTFGHEWTGTVVATSGAASRTTPGAPGEISPGTRVVGQTMVACLVCRTCRSGQRGVCPNMQEIGLYGIDGAAAQYVRVPLHALVPVPDAVDDTAAVLVEPAVTVARALADTRCSLADDVAVIGTGTIGLLAIMLARTISGDVTAIGVDAAGLDLAQRVGARRAVRSGEAPDEGYSLVIEASGTAAGLLEAVRVTRTGGRIAAVGVVGGGVQDFPAGEVTLRGLSLYGIRHGLDHYDQTLKLFADGVLSAEPLIHSRHPLARPDEAFEALANRSTGQPKVLLTTRA